MNAVNFPEMLKNNKTSMIFDRKATEQNLYNLLMSEKNTMLGDPFFGDNLHRMLFEKNNYVIRDIVLDDIYEAITTFMPQIRVERKNITISSVNSTVYVNIRAQNIVDYTFDDYSINLLNIEEF